MITAAIVDAQGRFLVDGNGNQFIGPILLAFLTSSLPDAIAGSPYSFQLAGMGGTPPYTFAFVSATGTTTWSVTAAGVLSGAPATVETDTVNIKISDAVGASVTQAFTLVVSAGGNFLVDQGGNNLVDQGANPLVS